MTFTESLLERYKQITNAYAGAHGMPKPFPEITPADETLYELVKRMEARGDEHCTCQNNGDLCDFCLAAENLREEQSHAPRELTDWRGLPLAGRDDCDDN